MLPVNRILCPTDFSPPASEAVRVAAELAGHFSAQLFLAHVVHPAPGMSLGQLGEGLEAFDVRGYEKALVAAAKRKLKVLPLRGPDVTAQSTPRQNGIYSGIHQYP